VFYWWLPSCLLNIKKPGYNNAYVYASTYVPTYVPQLKGENYTIYLALHTRGKSLSELWVNTFLPDWQPPLIFVWFISNFLCVCSNSVTSAHVIFKQITPRLRGAVSQVTHIPKSALPLETKKIHPDWQPPLIFVQFISNFLCMCSNSMTSAHVILK